MKVVVAAVRPTPILWWRASGLASPTEVPASTLPASWDGARSRQDRFEKCGFTALERAHQRNAPWTISLGTSDVLSHCRLLVWSSAHDWVGDCDAPPVPTIWQAGKSRCGDEHMPTGPAHATRRSELSTTAANGCAATALPSPESTAYRPGRSSRLSNPAAMLTPTWPCKLSGCSAIEFAEPPTSTLPPTPTPSVALPCAPT